MTGYDEVCPTCDGYEFVADGAGMLHDCPDCRGVPVERCRVHGRRLVGGRCPRCRDEARRGVLLLRGHPRKEVDLRG